MARKVSITKEMIVEAGVDFVVEYGIEKLNVRSLAEHLGCSIQPIFKNFGTMQACKANVIHALEGIYSDYIDQRLDADDLLFTTCLAHVQLAMENRNLFEIIFQAGLYHTRTVDEVIHSDSNREVVESIPMQYGVDTKTAQTAYRDIRFYSLGLAQAAYAGSVRFAKGECEELLRNAIAKFLGKIRHEKT